MTDHVTDRKIRWALLGTGRVAGEFAEDLRRVSHAVAWSVCSRELNRAKAFAATHGFSRACGSFDELLADDRVDVVYVATPPALHADHALRCLDAGKAVLVEKPFALNWRDGSAVVQRARQRSLFCMEAMWMRFIPAMEDACRRARAGEIGEPRMLIADFGVPVEPDGAGRFFDPGWGGGALFDRAVYPVSLAIALFGAPADVTSRATMASTGVDDLVSLTLRFPGGQLAALNACLRGYGSNEATLVGTRGRLRIHEPMCRPDTITLTRRHPAEIASATTVQRAGLTARLKSGLKESSIIRRLRSALGPIATRSSSRFFVPYAGKGYCHEAEAVTRCLLERRTESETMPLDDTLHVLRVLDASRASWSSASTAIEVPIADGHE